jgi:hypothetical protein
MASGRMSAQLKKARPGNWWRVVSQAVGTARPSMITDAIASVVNVVNVYGTKRLLSI